MEMASLGKTAKNVTSKPPPVLMPATRATADVTRKPLPGERGQANGGYGLKANLFEHTVIVTARRS